MTSVLALELTQVRETRKWAVFALKALSTPQAPCVTPLAPRYPQARRASLRCAGIELSTSTKRIGVEHLWYLHFDYSCNPCISLTRKGLCKRPHRLSQQETQRKCPPSVSHLFRNERKMLASFLTLLPRPSRYSRCPPMAPDVGI